MLKRLPVDRYTFSGIIENDFYYADKTDMVYDMTHKYKMVFLSRPRRFGKSMLCSTLESYFEGQKELFKGLAMEDLEQEWTKYPVFHFQMSDLKDVPVEGVKNKLWNKLDDYIEIYGKKEKESNPGSCLSGILKRAKEKTGRDVVVIIDEYDTPLLGVLDKPEMLTEVRAVMREFYQTIKDNEKIIRFAFITGITKFSQLSIFSTLNNLKNITLNPDYETICGITEQELRETLYPYVEEMSKKRQWTIEETFVKLKEQYDGYNFSEELKGVYNPFSLINSLSDKKIESCWFASGTPTFLINQMKRFDTDYASLENVTVSSDSFDVPTEAMVDALPLLFQSGYYTIKDYDIDSGYYTLSIPNKEVRVGMSGSLIVSVLKKDRPTNDGLVKQIYDSLREENLEGALQSIRSYISSIPYDVISKEEWEDKERCEKFYQLLLYLIFSFVDRNVQTEVKSIRGRADVVMSTKTSVYVLEFKVNSTAKKALAQIDEKGYSIPYEERINGRKLVKCGINISSKKRTIDKWIIENL